MHNIPILTVTAITGIMMMMMMETRTVDSRRMRRTKLSLSTVQLPRTRNNILCIYGLFLFFGATIMNNNVIQYGSCFVPTSISSRIASSSFSSSSPLSLSSSSSSQLQQNHFENLRKAFPKNANIVQAGGWTNLERLSIDPKGELVKFVVNGLKGNNSDNNNNNIKIQPSQQQQQQRRRSNKNNNNNNNMDTNLNETIEALSILLYGLGKGFTADKINGEWDLVFTKQGKKSPAFQKIIGRKETVGFSKNYFNIQTMIFRGDIRFWKFGKVETSVKYTPTSDSFSKSSNGKIVVRRIVCQIMNAFFKWWKLPGIPFPLPKKVGFLDIIYLDNDIRVTKGNRGGLFVHFRPEYLKKVLL